MIYKVCITTTTRAEYGLLRDLCKAIDASECFDFHLAVSGTHLSPALGRTKSEIDFYENTHEVPIPEPLMSSGSQAQMLSHVIKTFYDFFVKHQFDLIILLGDRFEIFGVAASAFLARIPIAHIHGGELTQGALDDGFRHSITKLSSYHFTAAREYCQRVIQMGEDPSKVFNVGSLGVARLKKSELLSKADLEAQFGFQFARKTLLIAYHPETLTKNAEDDGFDSLLNVLRRYPDYFCIFTAPNIDEGSEVICQQIQKFVFENHGRAKFVASLGHEGFTSCMQYVVALVGNSSSGLIEAPSLRVPTINIGDRQKGRLCASSVVNVKPEHIEIENALRLIEDSVWRETNLTGENPCDGGDSAALIVTTLRQLAPFSVSRGFFDA